MELAFAGRSNTGKSSVINLLTGRKQMAKTGRTPGKTRLMNVFTLREGIRLVDLPGYGYAKVSAQLEAHWRKELSLYFNRRAALKGVLMIMDIRHPLTEKDRQFLDWLPSVFYEPPGAFLHVLLNKADKLGKSAQASALMKTRSFLTKRYPGSSVQLFSCLKKQGKKELQDVLQGHLTALSESNQ